MKIFKGIYKWITATRLRKILSSILAVLILITSIRYIFLKPKIVLADSTLGFDEGYGSTVNDNNGNISGTITNAVWKSEEFCKVGKCLYFDGTGDLVNFGNDTDVNFTTGSFTIEGWFRTPDITTGTRVLVAKYNGATGTDGGYKVYMNSSGNLIFGIDNDQTGFPLNNASTSTTAFDDNQWHHFAAVKNGTTSISIYVDGNLYQTTSSITTSSLTNTDSFYVGIDGDGSSNGFSGYLDEIKVYSTSVRSPADIKTDLAGETSTRGTSASFGPSQSYISNGLIGYWKMDDGTGTSATDSSGNGNTGTLSTTSNPPTWGTGKFGTSTVFPGTAGTGAALSMGDPANGSLDFGVSSFTFGGWVKVAGNVGGSDVMLAKGATSSGNKGYDIELGTGAWRAHLSDGNAGSYVTMDITADGTPYTGIWTLLTLVVDRSRNTYTSYINGVPSNSADITSLGNIDTTIAFVLGSTTGGGSVFQGSIDDVRVYNRALSPAEVQSLYNWAPGPVGYWKMDEPSGNRNDSSTYGNNLTNNSTETPVIGKYGTAANFENLPTDNNESLNISNASQSGLGITGSLTVEAWINIESENGTSTEAIAGKDGAAGNRGYVILVHTTGAPRFVLSNDGTATSVLTGGTILATGIWYHIAAVYDGSTQKIYVNGISDVTPLSYSSGISNSQTTPPPFAVGGRGDTSGADGFDGSIDDVRVYNYARTPAQIIEDMNGGHPAPGSPVGSSTLYWNFDEGHDTTVNDTGTTGNYDGTMSGVSYGWSNDGKFGKGVTFNNDADKVSAGDVSWTDSLTQMTVSWWMLPGALFSGHDYISKTNHSTQNSFRIMTDAGSSGEMYVYIASSLTDTANFYQTTNLALSTTSWQYITVVYDGTQAATDRIKIYKNGKLVSGSVTGTIPASMTSGSTSSLTLGDSDTTGTTALSAGTIYDDLKIYTSALTTDQIKAELNRGSSAVMGATSTDSSGNATWSDTNSYCPPGQGSTCVGPVAEWKFDENTGTGTGAVKDTSGNSNNANTTNITNDDWVKGKFGGAMRFNTTSAVANAGSPAELDFTTGDFSFTVWAKINTNATGELKTFVNKGADANADPGYWFSYDAGTGVIDLRYDNNTGTDRCSMQSSGGLGANDGNWHHFAAVLDRGVASDTTYFYLDGKPVASESCVANLGTSLSTAETFQIGDNGGVFDMQGDMDQFRVWNYALSQQQIEWDYNRGAPVAWWEMDETSWTNDCSTATVFDNSGNGLNGKSCPASTGPTGGSTGKINNGGTFDGGTDHIEVSDYDITGQLSISAWVKPTAVTSDYGIISKRTPVEAAGDWAFRFSANNDGKLSFIAWDGLGGSDTSFGNNVVSTNVWTHVVVTFDDSANTVKFYINGNLDATDTSQTEALANNPEIIQIGYEGQSTYFSGVLDDVRLYNYVLTPQQVKNIMNDNSSTRFAPLTGSPQ